MADPEEGGGPAGSQDPLASILGGTNDDFNGLPPAEKVKAFTALARQNQDFMQLPAQEQAKLRQLAMGAGTSTPVMTTPYGSRPAAPESSFPNASRTTIYNPDDAAAAEAFRKYGPQQPVQRGNAGAEFRRQNAVAPGSIVDHVRPLARGGQDDPANLQVQSKADSDFKDSYELNDYVRDRGGWSPRPGIGDLKTADAAATRKADAIARINAGQDADFNALPQAEQAKVLKALGQPRPAQAPEPAESASDVAAQRLKGLLASQDLYELGRQQPIATTVGQEIKNRLAPADISAELELTNPYAKGIANTASALLTDPKNAAIAAGFVIAPPILAALGAAGFTVQQIEANRDRLRVMNEAYKNKDWDTLKQTATEFGLSLPLTVLGARGAMGAGKGLLAGRGAGAEAAGRFVTDPETGTQVKTNPPASPANEAAAAKLTGSADAVQAAKNAVKAEGADATVESNPDLPVSKTTESRGRTAIELAPTAGPAEALHEAQHAAADQGNGPEPAEGAGAKQYAEATPTSAKGRQPAMTLQPDPGEMDPIQKAIQANGAVSEADVPPTLEEKIVARKHLADLAQQLQTDRGIVGRTRTLSANSPDVEWQGVKSSLPKELQQGRSYDDISSLIQKGLAGKLLTEKQASYFADLEKWARKTDGPLTEAGLVDFLAERGLPSATAEMHNADAIAASERAGIASETGDSSFGFGTNAPSLEGAPGKLLERGGVGMDLNAQIPVIGPFVQQTVLPAARAVATAVADGAVGVAHAIQPRLFLSNKSADIAMERQGGINLEMDRLRLAKANAAMDSYFDNRTDAQNIDFMDRMMKRSTAEGQQPTKELQDMSKALANIDDKLYAELQKARPSQAWLDDHFAITWKVKPNAPVGTPEVLIGGPRPLEGGKGFMKRRVYDQLSDGIEAGGVPATTNPFKMLAIRAEDVFKYTKTADMLEKYKDAGLIKFVRPGETPPDGFQRVDASFSTKWFPVEEGLVKAGEYWWEPNTARVINNITAPSTLRNTSAGTLLMGAKNYMTQVELAGPFHASVVTVEAVTSGLAQSLVDLSRGEFVSAAKGAARTASVVGTPVKYATEGKALQQFLRDPNAPGVQKLAAKYGDLEQYLRDFYNGGGHDGQYQDYRLNATQAFREALNQGDALGAVIKHGAGVVVEKGMGWLFNHYIPDLRAGLFLERMASELRDNAEAVTSGQTSRSTLARRAMDQVDDRLGQMSYDSQFWNANGRFIAQLALRAPGWKLGTIRGFSRGLYGQVREFTEPMKGVSPEGRDLAGMSPTPRAPRLDPDMAWMLSLYVVTGTAASVLQKAIYGKAPWETDTPLTDFMAPRVGTDATTGKPYRILIPSYTRDVISATHNPASYLEHGASPLLSKGLEVLKNKDYYGNAIRDVDDPALQQAWDIGKHMAPVPFAITNAQKGLQRSGPAAAVAGAVGFAQAPSYISNSKLDDFLADRYQKLEKVQGRSKDDAAALQATRDAVAEATRTGDTSAIRSLDIGDAKKAAALKRVNETRQTAGQENAGLVSRLKPLDVDDLFKALDVANDTERPAVLRVLKYRGDRLNLANIAPSKRAELRAKFQKAFGQTTQPPGTSPPL